MANSCLLAVSVEIMEHLSAREDSGFVQVCLQADHFSQTAFEVMLTTQEGTAIGQSQQHAQTSL